MNKKRMLAVTVVCAVVAFAGIGFYLYSHNNKPVVLSASTKVTPTPIPVNATLQVFQEPVSIMLPDREATESAKTGMIVPQGTVISTGQTGRAQIVYPGGTVTRLDNSTSVKLSTYDSQKYQIVVDIFQGKIWSRIKKLLGAESYETKTSNTVATVRGTSYEHSVDELDLDQVIVLDGKVDFGCSKNAVLKTGVEANRKAAVHCNTDISIVTQPVTETDIQNEWVQFNKDKNIILEKQLENGIEPVVSIAASVTPQAAEENNKDKQKNNGNNTKDIPTNSPVSETVDNVKTKAKPTHNPKYVSPTPIVQIKPTAIIGNASSIVDTVNGVVQVVVSAIPTISVVHGRISNTPIPPTTAPEAVRPTSAPTPTDTININVNLGGVGVKVGL